MNQTETTFNRHLQQFKDVYKIFRNPDHIYSIKCRYGIIQPYSLERQLLMFVGTFRTKRQKNAFLKLRPLFCGVIFNSDTECNLVFLETKLKELELYLLIRKRRYLTEEQRRVLTFRLAKARLMK